MQTLNEHDNHHAKMLMTTYMRTKEEMRLLTPSETKKSVLLKKPEPFQKGFGVDSDGFVHCGETWSSYAEYIEEEEAKDEKHAVSRNAAKNANHPFLRIPDLTKCGIKICNGC